MLHVLRGLLLERIAARASPEEVRVAFENWFIHLKTFERNDDFSLALSSGRMTARLFDMRKPLQKFPLVGSPTIEVRLDPGLQGIVHRLSPENMLGVNKHLLGLHDLSAVLLIPNVPLSKQLFPSGKAVNVLFMPLALEADLVAFEALATYARENKGTPLYTSYRQRRAEFTRPKYGDDKDMTTNFVALTPTNLTRPRLRFGMANISGAPIGPEVLAARRANALAYRENVLPKGGKLKDGNNEIIMAYRSHDGYFPVVGMAAKDGYTLIAVGKTKKEPIGTLSDSGVTKLNFKQEETKEPNLVDTVAVTSITAPTTATALTITTITSSSTSSNGTMGTTMASTIGSGGLSDGAVTASTSLSMPPPR